MRTYKGRTRMEHEEWVKANAEYYTIVLHRGHMRYQTHTLEDAKKLVEHLMLGLERDDTQAARIYASKGQDGVLLATYHPIRGWKYIAA